MTHEQFIKIHNSYFGEGIDNVKQLAKVSFTGEELMEYVSQALRLTMTENLDTKKASVVKKYEAYIRNLKFNSENLSGQSKRSCLIQLMAYQEAFNDIASLTTPASPTMEWVRCDDRLPGKNGRYSIKDFRYDEMGCASFAHFSINHYGCIMYQFPNKIQWLDEKPNSNKAVVDPFLEWYNGVKETTGGYPPLAMQIIYWLENNRLPLPPPLFRKGKNRSELLRFVLTVLTIPIHALKGAVK